MPGLYGSQDQFPPREPKLVDRPAEGNANCAKICRPCFRDIYGEQRKIRTITWGRMCARCKRESKSTETLAKISCEELDKNPYMTPFGPIMEGPRR